MMQNVRTLRGLLVSWNMAARASPGRSGNPPELYRTGGDSEKKERKKEKNQPKKQATDYWNRPVVKRQHGTNICDRCSITAPLIDGHQKVTILLRCHADVRHAQSNADMMRNIRTLRGWLTSRNSRKKQARSYRSEIPHNDLAQWSVDQKKTPLLQKTKKEKEKPSGSKEIKKGKGATDR
jgi:hypothetical protein